MDGVVLVGGVSWWFGLDKILVELDGVVLFDCVVVILRVVCEWVWVIG